ncbi:MAG: hypothetical protein ABSH53_21735 [Holophaga sp.]|jgi:hypothetical protein
MSRFLCLAVMSVLPWAAWAQGGSLRPRPYFFQVGADTVGPGAGGFSPVVQLGAPVLQWGLTYLGVFGGGTQWRRGSFEAGTLHNGDLLDKTAYWIGLYGGGGFWTIGVAGEYAREEDYVTPTPTNAYFDGVVHDRAGAGVFISLHGRSGVGAFVRAGTQSGFGCGLSLRF